jgi:hypothetical protein
LLTVPQLRLLLHSLQPELELVVLRREPRRITLQATELNKKSAYECRTCSMALNSRASNKEHQCLRMQNVLLPEEV